MTSKLELTRLFLEQSGIVSSLDEFIVKEHLTGWWITPHSPIGFRLTLEGNRFLKDVLHLQYYQFKIKENNVKSLKLFLQMNKYISSPFYLKGQDTIVFYGETDAIMIGLYNGDLSQYFENFSR